MAKTVCALGLNSDGEIVTAVGSGTDKVVGHIMTGSGFPLDDQGRLILANVPKYAYDEDRNVIGVILPNGSVAPIGAVVSAQPPNNNDGRPDGTIYIQVGG